MNLEPGYSNFIFEYYHDGAWWSFTIPARSEQDAVDRVKKLPLAKYLGTVEMEIPVNAGAGLLARIICWWRNRYLTRQSA